MSQAKLAGLMSVDRSTVAKWEIDKHEPGPSLLAELSNILKVPHSWLTDPDQGEPASNAEVVTDSKLSAGFAASMAIRSWRGVMAALNSLEECEFVADDVNQEVPTAFLVRGPSSAERHDVLRVSGPSMAPRVRSGGRVLIFRDETLYPNSIVFATSPTGKQYLKVLRENGRAFELHSINEEGATFKDLNGWQIHGWAVAIWHDYEAGLPNTEWAMGSPLKA